VDDNSQRILQVVQGRVLVVEDDLASRYVAETLLDSLQSPTTIVSNGAEALELLRTQDFDLVLMDCEMPGIDGYEATRRARKLLSRHIPIVAMTAGIMAADRQRCLDAGMDDILSKPFSKAALNDMLCKWLSPQSAATRGRTLSERILALPVLDIGVFEELQQSLQWRLPPLRKLYDSFQESAHEAEELLGERREGTDPALLNRRLHSLQGSAGLVGARQIEHLAAWLTEALRRGEWHEAGPTILLLREALQRLRRELDERLNPVNGR
jgi:CheY-like chemotaxis protein